MGVSNLVATSSGLSSAIKSIQTGSAATAGTITITSVNTSKTVIMSFPTTSAGTVSVSGGINAMNVALNASNGNLAGINPWSGAVTSAAGQTVFGVGTGGNAYNALFNSGISYFAAMNTNVAALSYTGISTNSMSNGNTNATVSTTGLNQPMGLNAANGATSAGNFNTGTNSLYSASYGAYLTNATTLTVTGACQYQVVEYN